MHPIFCSLLSSAKDNEFQGTNISQAERLANFHCEGPYHLLPCVNTVSADSLAEAGFLTSSRHVPMCLPVSSIPKHPCHEDDRMARRVPRYLCIRSPRPLSSQQRFFIALENLLYTVALPFLVRNTTSVGFCLTCDPTHLCAPLSSRPRFAGKRLQKEKEYKIDFKTDCPILVQPTQTVHCENES